MDVSPKSRPDEIFEPPSSPIPGDRRVNSRYRPILWFVWVVIALSLGWHAWTLGHYYSRIDHVALHGGANSGTPLRQPVLAFAADAQTWIRYALQLDEGHSLRLRYTHIDNAPDGREVHWNSAWAWAIAGAGKVRQLITHEPLPRATERAALWLNPIVLFGLMVAFSTWVAQRKGTLAGAVVALGMTGSARFYEGFIPGYVDHHGLLTASVFGLTLGITLMGAGWYRTSESHCAEEKLLPVSLGEVRGGAIFSAVCGAIGLWISAASVVPAIALVGLAGAIATFVRGRQLAALGCHFAASAWRTWGRVGPLLSFGFYLLEYAPAHFGLRLEANHPLYALAWWGGAELVATLTEWHLGSMRSRSATAWRLVAASAAVLTVPTVIWIGGPRVFLLLDPFLAALHHRIFEFMSLPDRVRELGWRNTLNALNIEMIPFVVAVASLVWRRGRASMALWFTVTAGVGFVAMGIWQERWLLNSSGPLICVMLVMLSLIAGWHRWLRSPLVLFVLAAALYVPPQFSRVADVDRFLTKKTIGAKDALQPLFRDVAAALRASQPKGDIILLSSPNSSTAIGYYGRFQTIGTLYWENDAGLKTAARIFSAQTDEEAATMIRAHRITHIAMISEENFIAPYYELLHPNPRVDDVKKAFGYRLLFQRQIPVWLEVLPYRPPPDLQSLGVTVLLFKVDFAQSRDDAIYHLGLAQLSWGLPAAAFNTADALVKRSPASPIAWFRRCEILVAARRWRDAAASAQIAVSFAPGGDQQRLCISAARLFVAAGVPSYAVELYWKGLALGFEPTAARELAWLLATSKDNACRNGGQALQLALRLVRTDPHSVPYLDCLAAALAENGRFLEAIQTIESLVGKHDSTSPLARRLAAYRAGQAWRE